MVRGRLIAVCSPRPCSNASWSSTDVGGCCSSRQSSAERDGARQRWPEVARESRRRRASRSGQKAEGGPAAAEQPRQPAPARAAPHPASAGTPPPHPAAPVAVARRTRHEQCAQQRRKPHASSVEHHLLLVAVPSMHELQDTCQHDGEQGTRPLPGPDRPRLGQPCREARRFRPRSCDHR